MGQETDDHRLATSSNLSTPTVKFLIHHTGPAQIFQANITRGHTLALSIVSFSSFSDYDTGK